MLDLLLTCRRALLQLCHSVLRCQYSTSISSCHHHKACLNNTQHTNKARQNVLLTLHPPITNNYCFVSSFSFLANILQIVFSFSVSTSSVSILSFLDPHQLVFQTHHFPETHLSRSSRNVLLLYPVVKSQSSFYLVFQQRLTLSVDQSVLWGEKNPWLIGHYPLLYFVLLTIHSLLVEIIVLPPISKLFNAAVSVQPLLICLCKLSLNCLT